ncbi:hypothetical protein QEH56_22240 [Pelagicoccus enzymogenes]|uniref:hypothetical protein n=1 Tax=Pelagicoccus enzymogenes TaxID=2773457 RepID=UPI00280FAE4B|nr:hypothetical protein [Pelagicoccus enzymogenes]MDQ8200903.1 hypothetical protein [Pelagicoccus enzymogenes]
MNDLPPLLRDQRKVDQDQLRLLGIFHLVLAGLSLIGLLFMLAHYLIMNTVMSNPEMWTKADTNNNLPPPEEFFALFKWFYLFFGGAIVAGGVGNLLSGIFIKKRKNRTFSLVVGALNVLQFPFGTALGIFTFILLLRDSVRELYETRGAAKPSTELL